MGWRPQTFPVEPKIVVSRIHRNIIVKKRYLKLKIDKTRAWETGRRCECTLRGRQGTEKGEKIGGASFSPVFFRPSPHRFPQNILRNEGRGGIFESHGAFVSLIAKKNEISPRDVVKTSLSSKLICQKKKTVAFYRLIEHIAASQNLNIQTIDFPLKSRESPPFPFGIDSRGRGRGGKDKDVFLLLSRIFPYKFLFADAGKEDEGETRRKLAQNPHPNTLSFPPTTQYVHSFF